MVGCVWPLECASVGGASEVLPVSWMWMSVRWASTAATLTPAASTSRGGTPATACRATPPSWQTTPTSYSVKVSYILMECCLTVDSTFLSKESVHLYCDLLFSIVILMQSLKCYSDRGMI